MKIYMKNLHLLTAAAFFSTLTLISCKKDNTNNPPPDGKMDLAVQASQEDGVTNQQFNDVFNISLGVKESDAGTSIGLGTGGGVIYRPGGNEGTLGYPCFTVSVTPKGAGEWPKTAVFDFGNGCKGVDGKTRKGKIIVVFTNAAYMPGAKITTTFDGYSVDSFAISGTQTIENTTSGNNFGFSITIVDGKLTNTNNGFWHSLSGKHTWTLVQGQSTPTNFLDDQYQVTGTVQGGNSTGFTWSSEITDPLIRKLDCLWRVKGKLSIHWNQNPDGAILDYGDGTCDNKAVLTYLTYSLNINL